MGISLAMAGDRERFGGALLAITIALSAQLAISQHDEGVQPFEEELLQEADGVAPAVQYAKIPGFKFKPGSTKAKADSMGQCEQICNSQPKCKSFSWAKSESTCVWSTMRMKYDPDFVFSSKPKNGATYTDFPGMVYEGASKGKWLKSVGKSKGECAEMCDQAAACAAFSYRKRDKLCLLTGEGIGFHQKFDYYEKRGGQRVFGDKPKDAGLPAGKKAAKGVSGSSAPGPAPGPGPGPAGAPGPAPVVEKIVNKGEPEAVVAERLESVKKWASEKIQKKDQEEKLKLKAAEIDNKAKLEASQGSAEKKEAAEKIAEQKARADREAARQAAAAKEKAAQMIDKVKMEAQKASTAAEMAQAAAEAKQAKATVEKANKKDKELGEKKDLARKKEIGEKTKAKQAEDKELKSIKEKDAKANKVQNKESVTETAAKITKKAKAQAKAMYEKT